MDSCIGSAARIISVAPSHLCSTMISPDSCRSVSEGATGLTMLKDDDAEGTLEPG